MFSLGKNQVLLNTFNSLHDYFYCCSTQLMLPDLDYCSYTITVIIVTGEKEKDHPASLFHKEHVNKVSASYPPHRLPEPIFTLSKKSFSFFPSPLFFPICRLRVHRQGSAFLEFHFLLNFFNIKMRPKRGQICGFSYCFLSSSASLRI